MAVERASPSALAHFDPADLLDALSTGIIMLDAQLCPVYANVAAQDLLAFSLNTARGLPAAALREYTQVIIAEADRLTALVDSMAGPSRSPSKSELNVHEICEHVYHLLRAEAPGGIAIERDYDPSLPNAMLDRHQIIQALLNVARNALQAQGEPGRIVLRTRARSNVSIGRALHRLVASVQVEDSGPGVPAHLRSSIFYPLVSGRANGSGVGLAVAQDLVTRNGGIIEFESEPGRTVFTLLLPLGEDA